MSKRLFAEFLGTFWLVFGGCGSAVLAAAFPDVGIGLLGVAFAFGLTVLTMAYAVGGISGGHFNPAVSVGLFVAGRFEAKDLLPYVVAQVDRRGGRLRGPLYNRHRQGRLHIDRRLRHQRLWRRLARQVQPDVGAASSRSC